MSMNNTVECKEHPSAAPSFVVTPDLTHYGKYVCSVCGKFLTWVKTPEGQEKKKRKYVIGGLTFNTKTAVTDYTKETLLGTEAGQALSGERFGVIRDLLNFHPEAEQKIGCGVERIEVRRNPEFGHNARGFWIVRTDGTETDFSYKKCLEGDSAYRNKFIRACRFAVKQHMEDFKSRFFDMAVNPTCQLTGASLTTQNSHVDHIPPYTFERIVQSFAVLNSLNLDDPSLCENGTDGLLIPSFATELIRDKFVYYHNAHAQLRVISADANMSLVTEWVRNKESQMTLA